ncbi:hypothetical protein ABPG72_002210 [Tetrahymena utriculariae]
MTYCKNCGLQKNHIEQQCNSQTFSLYPQQQQNISLKQEYLVNQSNQQSVIGYTGNTLKSQQSNHRSPDQANYSSTEDIYLKQLLEKYNNNQDSTQPPEKSLTQRQKESLRDKYLKND